MWNEAVRHGAIALIAAGPGEVGLSGGQSVQPRTRQISRLDRGGWIYRLQRGQGGGWPPADQGRDGGRVAGQTDGVRATGQAVPGSLKDFGVSWLSAGVIGQTGLGSKF